MRPFASRFAPLAWCLLSLVVFVPQAGAAVTTFSPPGCAGGYDSYCFSVTEAPNGEVLAASSLGHVLRLSSSGEVLGGIGTSSPGRLDYPSGVATDAAGNVFVTDGGGPTRVYNAAGTHLRDLGSSSDRAIAVTPGGAAYVSAGTFVFAFDSSGAETAHWPREQDGRVDLYGIAVSPVDGHVFVAETRTQEIVELTPSLEEVRRWSAVMGLNTGVAVDAAGDVYVARHTVPYGITKYSPSGTVLGSFGSSRHEPVYGLSIVGQRLWAGRYDSFQRIDLDRPVAVVERDKDPRTTQRVTFDARRSFMPFGSIDGCRFDLDGDGSYETDAGEECTATRRFDSAGTFTVGVRVTAAGETADAAMIVPVSPSSASLAGPGRVLTGHAAGFDASGSVLPDADIDRYEWDLDGNGSFETTTSTPKVERAYASRGAVDVAVRVIRTGGVVDTATTRVSVLPAPPSGPIGVSINGGALYTNDPNVTLTVHWPAFTESMLVSNDGGFAGASPAPVAASYAWRLAESGPERQPKIAYVRFDGGTQTFQDDIILDQTPPAIAAATRSSAVARSAARRSRTVTVRVAARDRTSGVARLQLGSSRKARLTVKRNARTVRVNGFTPRYVRARDRAGNWSAWKAIRTVR